MSKKIFLLAVKKHVGNEVEISGWIFNKRSSGSIIFLQIRDGTGTIQGVFIKNTNPDNFKQALSLGIESSVIVTGKVKEDKRAPSGYELEILNIKIVQAVGDDYPIGKKEHGADFLLNNRHLWLRSSRQRAILKIRDKIILSINEYYKENNFIKIDTPEITPNACEKTTTLFKIDYFGNKKYLSQSGQLYLEAAIFAFGRVYDFQPVFRAEKSKTRRHLIEFWMSNAESAFVKHEENMKIQEELIIKVVQDVLTNCEQELKTVDRDLAYLKKIKAPFPKLTYNEAIKKLQNLGSDIKMGEDFGNDDETLLTKAYLKPIFIEFYPAKIKAFYMKRHPDKKELALCNDLLAPEGYGEIIGGSEREDDYDKLLSSIKAHKLSQKDFSWYLDLRKYGSVPHSGFGLGLERILAWICGLKHVRETIPFPRLINRSYP